MANSNTDVFWAAPDPIRFNVRAILFDNHYVRVDRNFPLFKIMYSDGSVEVCVGVVKTDIEYYFGNPVFRAIDRLK